MIFVTAYNRLNPEIGRNEDVEMLFNPGDECFYHKGHDGVRVMGKVENFVFPNVEIPSRMRTPHARKVTRFAMDWINKKEKRKPCPTRVL